MPRCLGEELNVDTSCSRSELSSVWEMERGMVWLGITKKKTCSSFEAAYQLAPSLECKSTTDASNSASDPGDWSIWDVIWKMNIPEKIKIFR